MMTVDLIIERLGGADAAARLTGVGAEAIRKWRQARSIPPKHWSTIIRHTDLSLSDLAPSDNNTETDAMLGPLPPAAPACGATAALVLADGTVFWGRGFGAKNSQAVGEICFSTGMTGYQETLTDPSFAGQIITFTFPHIGNVGTNALDSESRRIHARGLVVARDITQPASWRAESTLEQWLEQQQTPGICSVDTRALTLHIRRQGPQTAVLSFPPDGKFDIEALTAQARAWPGLVGMDLAREVTCRASYSWEEGGTWIWPDKTGTPATRPDAAGPWNVVAVDYGIKHNILRCLTQVGCRVTVVPATASAEDILKHKPDGVFLSNGPGDPEATGAYAVPAIQGVLQAGVPIFGICLGHQLLARALGAKTYKLPQGHRGANQPVKHLSSGRVEITSQNHGFAVDVASLPPDVKVTHTSLFDGSNEGIMSETYPAFSVQYHPESSPGPSDSRYLFEQFCSLMAKSA